MSRNRLVLILNFDPFAPTPTVFTQKQSPHYRIDLIIRGPNVKRYIQKSYDPLFVSVFSTWVSKKNSRYLLQVP
jgi:hypothetical protein